MDRAERLVPVVIATSQARALPRPVETALSASVAFGLRCEGEGEPSGVRPSMGSLGDAYDNAMRESVAATLECALLARRKFQTKAEARLAAFTFIEGWYDPVRLHSAPGYRSAIHYEQKMLADP